MKIAGAHTYCALLQFAFASSFLFQAAYSIWCITILGVLAFPLPPSARGIEALLLTEADLIELPEYCHKKQLP